MKKGLVVLLLLGILLIIPLVQAQTYSGFNRFTNNVQLFFSGGDNKVIMVLEIREKEVNSAMENFKNGDEKDSSKNLEKAWKRLQFIQEKVSFGTAEEVKGSVNETMTLINEEGNLSNEFDVYILEEEKTGLTAELTQKTFEYCKKIANEDFDLMLKEEKCNPKTAQPGLEKELKELKNIQEELFIELMWNIRSCIDDPGTCNCDEVVDISEKAKCEKMVALAVKCEYKEDETSCGELKAMEPEKGDGFAESFVPDFLMDLFKKNQSMIEYNIIHSDGVPEECWDENDKPECEQYDYLKEGYGRKNNEEKSGNLNKEPTMQESIPQCFDEEGNFLEEKCGKIIIIRNEEGLINYIAKNQIDEIINEFENKSKQHTMDINGSGGQNKIDKVEMSIDKVDNEISNWVVENDVVGEEGDDGLVSFVKTDIAGGDGGLNPEVKTYVKGDGTVKDDSLPEPDLNEVNPDLYNSDARAPGDTIDGTYDNNDDGTYADNEIVGGDGGEGVEGTNDVAPAV